MLGNDLRFRHALGAGGADVVGVEHLEHVRAHIAHPRADGDEHQRHDGQHQMLCHIEDLTKLAEGVEVTSCEADEVEPAELDAEDEL